jgi:hypothetical protein
MEIMKIKADLKNEVKLTPVFTKDKKAEYCKVHYKGSQRLLPQVKPNRKRNQIFCKYL